ncbi:MAG TPA: hypothetical protein VFB94_06695 [Acidimicrobiales bacterium]|nr:hypothetical protein [Acidimicrobiales bacterium]
MPEPITPPPEPDETGEMVSMELGSGPGIDSEQVLEDLSARVLEDLAELTELTEAGVELDGEVQVAETTWVIYGHTSYDGELIAGEYHDAIEASEVLRAAPRRPPADDDSQA